MNWRSIPLTTSGFCAIVDEQDFAELNKYRWHLGGGGGKLRNGKGHYYASRTEIRGGKAYNVFMHRVILGLTDGSIFTDHINNNSLDNRRCNLRTCTNTQNQARLPPRKVGKYKGVFYNKSTNKYIAMISFEGQKIYGGLFIDAQSAAKKYDEMAILYFTREFAFLNFP